MTTTELENLLRKNKITFNEVDFNGSFFTIHIEWGDWKHEHLALKHFLKNNDFVYFGSHTTEEDGSDTYSADHYCTHIEEH